MRYCQNNQISATQPELWFISTLGTAKDILEKGGNLSGWWLNIMEIFPK